MKNLACIVLLLVTTALAVATVNTTDKGVAIKGYDAVAYFQTGKAINGKPEHQHRWMNAKWYFANVENLALFAKDPAKYAPQYGGHCAYAASRNYIYDADPQVWKVVENKLYLNYNKDAQKLWQEDIPGNIATGNQNWPKLAEGAAKKKSKEN